DHVWSLRVLATCADQHACGGDALEAVFHGMILACSFGRSKVGMRLGGTFAAQGDPSRIVTTELVEDVFGLRCRVVDGPETGTPMIVPAARQKRARRGSGEGGSEDHGPVAVHEDAAL